MTLNVCSIDRVLRIGVGFALIAWVMMGGPLWALIGILPLVTGLLGFCPVYPLIGFGTCSARN